ncbi:MAG TPA: Trk system potassium transporter TrkA [Solirubrobacteraceae bacterium]|nr:Trk system potassium transporter TrkA [Solirubrobacteraceae bacterium]
MVIGAGDVGQHIARTLSSERHDVTVVDHDRARVEALQGDLDALVMSGNGASPRFLADIGAGEADLLCAVTQSDEANIIAALAGRQIGAKRTVARVRDIEYFGGDAEFAREVLGVDVVVHPELATADDLAESILLPGAVHVEHFADGRVAVAELVLSNRSPLLGNPLGDRRMVRPNFIFGLIREGRAIAAEEFHRPKLGDHVLVAAARDDIRGVVAQLAGRTSTTRDVIVFGGGRVGLPLARRLEETGDLRVTLLEPDPDRARHVAERLSRTTVLVEEELSKQTLLAHGADRTGAFVACAADDRANLLAAMHAKQLGADVCLAVVSREEFTPLVDALGIDAAFSPRLVTAETILRQVRGENVHAMYLLLTGAEVLEVQVDPGSHADGRTVEQTAVRAHARVAALVRDGKVLIPRGDERVQSGDRMLMFNTRRGIADVQSTFTAA